ncbi:MAG: HlyD family secretion protein [Solirubrobacteraceae bacterium]|nr:HlyD family secretion protein [Solirubrobacteraceae bacterium]
MASAREGTPRWLTVALSAGAVALIVLAALLVGPPEQASSVQSRVVKVATGVVQSTVSGSGNIQAATQLDLGFKTAGVVQRIYVTQGEHVTPGKLLAELNPQSAEVTLEQAKATLQAAEATLSQEEESGGETSSGQSAGSSGGKTTASTAVATTASVGAAAVVPTATTPATTTTPTPTSTTPTSTSKTPSTPTSKAPSTSTTKAPSTSTSKAPSTTTSGSSTTASEAPKQSAATREANLASARAAVKSDKLAVQSDQQSVTNTKLYAPDSGTIVSLSGEVGESVSGGGTSKASTSASSSTSEGGSGATGGATSRGSTSSSTSSSASSSSSTPAFAVLSDLGTMQLVVPLSESEIVHVHVGQPATVTVEALEGIKLAAHVVSVATLSTSNSGVVSYPVTFQLDQAASGLKPGMSASAEVVVKQQEGVNVPTSAISGKAVTVVRAGKRVRQAVVTGLAGNSSTIILSGLKAGEEIVLPIASTSGSTSITSRLGGRGGGALGGGGAFPGGGLGGGAAPGGVRGGG